MGFPGGSVVKNLNAKQEILVQSFLEGWDGRARKASEGEDACILVHRLI